MRTKQSVGLVLSLCCALAAAPARSVSIGPDVIVTGNKIEVVRPGPDLQAIIDGITDAAENNPYLIKLGVGEFTIVPDAMGFGLTMKENVSIMGSGQGQTVLTGAVSSGTADGRSAIVAGATNAALTDLSVENTGGGAFSIGIYNAASPRIERVTASASGGQTNYGVRNVTSATPSPTLIDVVAKALGAGAAAASFGVDNQFASSPTLINVTAEALGGGVNIGVSNGGTSSATLVNVTATAEGVMGVNRGVDNSSSSSPTLIDVIATGDGGNRAVGVINSGLSAPTLFGVIATGKNGTLSFGVESTADTVLLTIDASTLKGAIALRFGGNTGTRIANSRLIGTIANDPVGTTQCGGVYSATLAPVSC